MEVKLELENTAIPSEMKLKMENRYFWDPEDTAPMYKVLFTTISKFLWINKSKDGKVALTINDEKANLLMAALITYLPNEANPKMPGNWNLSYTLNAEDIADAFRTFDIMEKPFQVSFADVSSKMLNIGFSSGLFIVSLCRWCVELIVENLDKNAKDGDDVYIELAGMFIAKVEVVDGAKVMTIEPGAASKEMIKDDASIAV